MDAEQCLFSGPRFHIPIITSLLPPDVSFPDDHIKIKNYEQKHQTQSLVTLSSLFSVRRPCLIILSLIQEYQIGYRNKWNIGIKINQSSSTQTNKTLRLFGIQEHQPLNNTKAGQIFRTKPHDALAVLSERRITKSISNCQVPVIVPIS